MVLVEGRVGGISPRCGEEGEGRVPLYETLVGRRAAHRTVCDSVSVSARQRGVRARREKCERVRECE